MSSYKKWKIIMMILPTYWTYLIMKCVSILAWTSRWHRAWLIYDQSVTSRMTTQCIEKTKSDLDYQRVFPDISSPASIWKISDDECDGEESISNDSTLYHENVCFAVSSLCNEREKHINTYYSVTGWMLCAIPHIRVYV